MPQTTITLSEEAQYKLYSPRRLLTVTTAVPAMRTEASSMGKPWVSRTEPKILTRWADAVAINRAVKVRKRRRRKRSI